MTRFLNWLFDALTKLLIAWLALAAVAIVFDVPVQYLIGGYFVVVVVGAVERFQITFFGERRRF